MISLRNPCMAPHCIHCINITSSSTSASSQHTLTFFLCTLFTPHTTNLPLGAHKTQKASPTSKQTATCIICILFILIFHQWSRIFSRYQHFFFLFSLYFTPKLASLVFFFYKAFSLMIVHSRTRQLSPGTCANLHFHLQNVPSIFTIIAFSRTADVFFTTFILYHDKFTFIYSYIFFLLPHIISLSFLFVLFFLIKCIASKDTLPLTISIVFHLNSSL